LARLLLHALLGFDQVALRGPRVRRASWNLTVAEVLRRRSTMLGREIQLGSRVIVEACRVLLRLGRSACQFQTLTSR
jgi:hypothetical protein